VSPLAEIHQSACHGNRAIELLLPEHLDERRLELIVVDPLGFRDATRFRRARSR
jgi:hypothetical protein